MLSTLILLLACGSGAGDDSTTPTGGQATSGEGTLALSFRIDADYLTLMDEDAVGNFYGAFWLGSDVTSLGPNDGAVDLGSIFVEGLDLRDAGPTGVLFTSGALPAEEIVILGFLDSDANADPNSPDPDNKDPVTLPNDNDFDVVGDAETPVEVFFGLLNP